MTNYIQNLILTIGRIKDTAAKFKNPGFSTYFLQKAEDSLKFVKERGDEMPQEELQKLLSEFQELESVLSRQESIHNMYYKDKPNVEK